MTQVEVEAEVAAMEDQFFNQMTRFSLKSRKKLDALRAVLQAGHDLDSQSVIAAIVKLERLLEAHEGSLLASLVRLEARWNASSASRTIIMQDLQVAEDAEEEEGEEEDEELPLFYSLKRRITDINDRIGSLNRRLLVVIQHRLQSRLLQIDDDSNEEEEDEEDDDITTDDSSDEEEEEEDDDDDDDEVTPPSSTRPIKRRKLE